MATVKLRFSLESAPVASPFRPDVSAVCDDPSWRGGSVVKARPEPLPQSQKTHRFMVYLRTLSPFIRYLNVTMASFTQTLP